MRRSGNVASGGSGNAAAYSKRKQISQAERHSQVPSDPENIVTINSSCKFRSDRGTHVAKLQCTGRLKLQESGVNARLLYLYLRIKEGTPHSGTE